MRDYLPEQMSDDYFDAAELLAADPEYALWCAEVDAANAAEEARLYRENEAAWASADRQPQPGELLLDGEPCPF